MASRPTSPLILSLETASLERSVVVADGARIAARVEGRAQREHTSSVLADIHEALSLAGLKLNRIDLFAVATGPGSFTGLRAGLATMKAFALTTQRPLIGVPTLHAVAFACGESAQVVATLPAGRGEVFAQLLSVSAQGVGEELSQPTHMSPDALCEQAKLWGGDLRWAGPGALLYADRIRQFAEAQGICWREANREDGNARPVSSTCWTPARPVKGYAEQVAALALVNYGEGREVAAHELSALYVRLSDAELNERCRGLK